VRNLNDPDPGISKEADRAYKEAALWYEIRIENRYEIGARRLECPSLGLRS
jgi:hypothetical protein